MLTNKLDFYQPTEHAEFKKGFSTNDYLQNLRRFIQKCEEYNISSNLGFIDFQEAFNSVEFWTIFEGLKNTRKNSRYTNLHINIYGNTR